MVRLALCSSILLLLVAFSDALPDGPPLEACKHMRPGTRQGEIGMEGHTTSSQNDWPTYGNSKIPPYYMMINPSALQYTPGQEYSVYVMANQTYSHNYYKGIIMQARKVICASNTTVEVEVEPYGTFTVGSNSETLLQTMDCTHDASTVGHRSPQMKINETAKWRAPDNYVGHLVFRATIVQTATVYWTDVYSSIMQDPTKSMYPTCSAPISTRVSCVLTITGLLLLKIII